MWSSIGVPAIRGVPSNISTAAISFGGSQLINALFGNYWGIFDQNGIPLLLSDNVKSVKYQAKSKISTAPVESGSFANYNKVIEPYMVDLIMTKSSGGVRERSAFLGLLETFSGSTDLFMVITPDAIYPNCNIIGYDYVREAGDGARMIKANIHLQEVREVVVQYTQTKTDTAQASVSSGSVSPAPVSNNPVSTTSSPGGSVLHWVSEEIRNSGKTTVEALKDVIADTINEIFK